MENRWKGTLEIAGTYICPECFSQRLLGDVLLADTEKKLPMRFDPRRTEHCRQIYYGGRIEKGRFYFEDKEYSAYELQDWRALRGSERQIGENGRVAGRFQEICPRCHAVCQRNLYRLRPTQVLGNSSLLEETLRHWLRDETCGYIHDDTGEETAAGVPLHVRRDWNDHFICRHDGCTQWLAIERDCTAVGTYRQQLFFRQSDASEAVLFLFQLEETSEGEELALDRSVGTVLHALEESGVVRERMKEKAVVALTVLPDSDPEDWEERHSVFMRNLRNVNERCSVIAVRERDLTDPKERERILCRALGQLAELTGARTAQR